MRKPWPLYMYAGLLYTFIFAPIIFLIVNSVNADRYGETWAGFTAQWYIQAWTGSGVIEATKNSLLVATASTALSLVLGTLAALGRPRWWIGVTISASTYARILIPELVLALSVLVFLTSIGFVRGFATIVIGHTLFSSAYVTIIVAARLARASPATQEAARDLGATAWRAFWRVRFWEIMPAIVASGLLVFIFSLDDVVTTYFLSGSTVTLPLYVYGLIRFEVSPVVNALGTSMMALTSILMAGFAVVNWRWAAGRRASLHGSDR
jgi:spermidine/putrescine transport system permease protein